MLRRAPLSLKRSLRNLHTYANYERQSGFTVGKALATAVVTGSVLWYSADSRVHNDALPFSEKQQKLASPSLARLTAREDLSTVAWGSNRHAYCSQSSDFFSDVNARSGLLSPDSSSEVCGPTILKWLDNIALRDLAFHKYYAAYTDARGDVHQWNGNASSQQSPKLILEGKVGITIVKLHVVLMLCTGYQASAINGV